MPHERLYPSPTDEIPYTPSVVDRFKGHVAMCGLIPMVVLGQPTVNCENSATMREQLSRELGVEIDRLPEERKLTAGTFNVGGKEARRKGLAEILQENPLDILCLQETTLEILKTMREETGLTWVAGWPRGETFGNAILTRFPVFDYKTHDLTSPKGREQRRLLTATLFDGSEELVIAATHLINKEPGLFGSRRIEARLRQVRDILRILNSEDFKDKRILFCGDLNTSPGTEGYNMLLYLFDETVDAMNIPCVITFPFDKTQKDYIWYTHADFLPMDMSVKNGYPSDHNLLVTTFLKQAKLPQ